MNQPLLILPFDHRSSFSKNILGLEGKLNKTQKKEISDLKKIIFEAFLSVQKKYRRKNYFGILVDEEYGLSLLREAKKHSAIVTVPVEKSGQEVLAFEYGWRFGAHIRKANPDYVKVLIRYNPLNQEINQRQAVKLKKLDQFCQKNNYKIILELLVPPTEADLKIAKTEKNYNSKLRLTRTIDAIKEIKKMIGVDVWKLEGFDKSGWQKIIKVTGVNSKIIFLGRGEDKKMVTTWLKSAIPFKQLIGFAIGRTIFLETLQKYHAEKITHDQAIKEIATKFDYFVKLWAGGKKIDL